MDTKTKIGPKLSGTLTLNEGNYIFNTRICNLPSSEEVHLFLLSALAWLQHSRVGTATTVKISESTSLRFKPLEVHQI